MKTGLQKFNKKNALIMGAIGFVLGIVGTMLMSFASIGPGQEPNYIYSYIMIVLLTLTFGFWGSRMDRDPSGKIDLPIRYIRIALIISWIIIFYLKFRQ